jgi:hypothetical protein
VWPKQIGLRWKDCELHARRLSPAFISFSVSSLCPLLMTCRTVQSIGCMNMPHQSPNTTQRKRKALLRFKNFEWYIYSLPDLKFGMFALWINGVYLWVCYDTQNIKREGLFPYAAMADLWSQMETCWVFDYVRTAFYNANFMKFCRTNKSKLLKCNTNQIETLKEKHLNENI